MRLAQPCHNLPLDTFSFIFHSYACSVDRKHCFWCCFTDFLAWKATNRSVDLAHVSLNLKALENISWLLMEYMIPSDLSGELVCSQTYTRLSHTSTMQSSFLQWHKQWFSICTGHPGAFLPQKEPCFLCNRSQAVTTDGLVGHVVMSIHCLDITL